MVQRICQIWMLSLTENDGLIAEMELALVHSPRWVSNPSGWVQTVNFFGDVLKVTCPYSECYQNLFSNPVITNTNLPLHVKHLVHYKPPASSAFKSSSAWLARRLIGLVLLGWPLISPDGAPVLFSWRGCTGWNFEDVSAHVVDSSLDCCWDEVGDDAALSLVSPTLELTDWLSLSPSSATKCYPQ